MKKVMTGLLAFSLVAMLGGCSTDNKENDNKEVTVVLDYVPNTNHTGLYVALNKGYFEEEGLQVNIVEPGNDGTSATLVATGKGQFGVSYQEDVTYALTSEEPLPIKAIATVIQHNTSGFVTSKKKDIKSPKDFENKTYSGWQSPSEEAVIKACMNAEGADPSKLTIVGDDGSGFAALDTTVDVKWYFEGWDLIKASMAGADLNYMPLRDYDARLDYYTPVIIANNDVLENDPELAKSFMRAVKKGYEFAIANPKESAQILHTYASDYEIEFLEKSQEFLSSQYSKDAQSWGIMKDEVWNNYTDFMFENGLIKEKISADKQYTNEFIK